MRSIDRWAGSVCCALVSAWHRLLGRPQRGAETPKAIAFIALAEIGALVLAYPAIARARRLYPDAKIYFVTFSAGGGMLGIMGVAPEERVIIDPTSPTALVRTTCAAVARMRAIGIDTVVNFEVYARFSTLLAYLSGASLRVGFQRFHEEGHYLGNLYTHRLVYNPHMHITAAYVSLVEAISGAAGGEPLGKVPRPDGAERLRWSPPQDVTQAVRDKLAARVPGWQRHQIVILNPNASDLVAQRRWPAQNYIDLATRLLEDDGVMLVLSGAGAERSAANDLAARIGSDRVAVLAGETTLPELIGLYEAADLLITNDSGPVHFASVTDVPTLALFGPETPRIFGPIGPKQQAVYANLACSPCVSVYNQKRSACGLNECMRTITPESVYIAARGILLGRRAERARPV